MTLEDKISQIKKWVSLIEGILTNISLFFKEHDYSKLEEDTVVGLELKIEKILKIYQQESVNLEFISYTTKSHDNKDLEITFSQGSDCIEKKTTCFDEILNKINSNIDELLNLKVLDEFINYAEEKKINKKDLQRYQRMSKETIQNILASFKILNKFIFQYLGTIFHIEFHKEMSIDSTQYDNKYIQIRQSFGKNKEKYLKFFDINQYYIEDLLTNYEEFSIHKEAMVIEKLYTTLKCTEKFEAVTPQRKPLKRKKIERRNTICDDTYKISCRLIYVNDRYSVWPMSPPLKKQKERSNSTSPQKTHKDRSNSAPPVLSSLYYKETVWSQDTVCY